MYATRVVGCWSPAQSGLLLTTVVLIALTARHGLPPPAVPRADERCVCNAPALYHQLQTSFCAREIRFLTAFRNRSHLRRSTFRSWSLQPCEGQRTTKICCWGL